VASRAWRIRLVALATAGGFLVVGLGIRALAGVDSSGALAQHSGTALYAAMIYAGLFILVPRAEPWVAGVAAIAFCWLVEVLQLTGLPAELSERSLLARLVLGVHFDALDLVWYAIGVLPLVALHAAVARHRW
jgi:small neutral amino acid transporter SnatA (MarC family)